MVLVFFIFIKALLRCKKEKMKKNVCVNIIVFFHFLFLQSGDCSHWVESGHCTHKKIYTASFFTLHALILILTIVMGAFMLKNFGVDVGDFIERFLVQERNIEQVMAMARNGKLVKILV